MFLINAVFTMNNQLFRLLYVENDLVVIFAMNDENKRQYKSKLIIFG